MELILAGLTYEICLIYLDDILVFSRTFEEHCLRLGAVLDRLDKHTLKLKPSKCHLFQRKVSFLGHVISAKGIECDPCKTIAISDWPRPVNVSAVRTFCGLASYYRTFVPHFAHVAKPLHDLTRKNVTFAWTEDCKTLFRELQKRLTSPPILVAPRDEGEYVLDTDASDFALGAVLHQRQDGVLKVIGYASRSLTAPERRYCITRRELLGVVFGLRKFRQHLLGRRVVVRTDHAALTHLMRTPEPIGQQGRWLDFLAEFDLEILHRAGKNHSNSDALSRRPCERGTTTDCPQCIRGTTVGAETAAGRGDDNQLQQSSSSAHAETTQGEVKSILSPTATPFYPANASREEIAESQESVFTLPTCQNIYNEMSKLQGSWSHATDPRSVNDYVGDRGIAGLSNSLPVLPSATILPQLCVSLSMLCPEVIGIQRAAAESSIRTRYPANQMIQQQHLQTGVVRQIRSETRYESSLTATKNYSDGTKTRDLLPSKQLRTRRPRPPPKREDRALSNRRDIDACVTHHGFVDSTVNLCQPQQPSSDVPTSKTSCMLTQLNASSFITKTVSPNLQPIAANLS